MLYQVEELDEEHLEGPDVVRVHAVHDVTRQQTLLVPPKITVQYINIC